MIEDIIEVTKDYAPICIVTAIGLTLCALLMYWGLNSLNEKSCKETAKMMGLECNYSVYTGCLIRIDGEWILLDHYKTVKTR